MFTRTLRFGTYRTKVSSHKQPSSGKISALVFHSTNWTQVEAECFSGSWPQKVSPGQNFSVATNRESPTTFVWKKVISLFRSIIWEQIQDDCYIASCRQWCSPRNDSFKSWKTFFRKDCRLGVSLNKLDNRWKQNVFLVVVPKKFHQGKNFDSYRTRVSNNFRLKKGNFFALF